MTDGVEPQALMKATRLAAIWNKNVRWVKDAIKRGELAGHLLGGEVMVTVASAAKLLEETRLPSKHVHRAD